MAERFERSIQDWYQNSRTANLEFLNLANPNLSDLSNNITILYNELSAKLAGITITGEKGKEPIKATSAPYYVFKNPRVIFNEEKTKK